MSSKTEMEQIISLIEVLAAIVLVVLLLALASVARAQQPPRSVEFDPAALEKARTALLLRSGQSQLADLEGELNHLAVLSETCRVEFGAQACGLDATALTSDKLEERFSYYVKHPVQSQNSGHQVKVDRNSWVQPNGAASR